MTSWRTGSNVVEENATSAENLCSNRTPVNKTECVIRCQRGDSPNLFLHNTEEQKLQLFQNRVTEDEYIQKQEGGSHMLNNVKRYLSLIQQNGLQTNAGKGSLNISAGGCEFSLSLIQRKGQHYAPVTRNE